MYVPSQKTRLHRFSSLAKLPRRCFIRPKGVCESRKENQKVENWIKWIQEEKFQLQERFLEAQSEHFEEMHNFSWTNKTNKLKIRNTSRTFRLQMKVGE